MKYELFYWPSIKGRGEFIRLVLEDAAAPYSDVCREPGGMARMQEILRGEAGVPLLPLAPPFLRADDLWLGQTANITAFLGERLGRAPLEEQGRLIARTMAFTIADFVGEIHDTHHPIAVDKYYEQQKDEAMSRASAFRTTRLPKFLRYFERVIDRNANGVLVGRDVSYVDLSAFQVVDGLLYAFPRALESLRPQLPKLLALHERIAKRPNVASYLASSRRLPYCEQGIFRQYSELDA